jgi:hypothetical protein
MMTDAEIQALMPPIHKPDDATRERDAMNIWSMYGIDGCVSKIGRQWRAAQCFGFPVLFKTKTAAYDACTAMVLECARRRAESR